MQYYVPIVYTVPMHLIMIATLLMTSTAVLIVNLIVSSSGLYYEVQACINPHDKAAAAALTHTSGNTPYTVLYVSHARIACIHIMSRASAVTHTSH